MSQENIKITIQTEHPYRIEKDGDYTLFRELTWNEKMQVVTAIGNTFQQMCNFDLDVKRKKTKRT